MTVTRSSTGKLWSETWDTNTLSSRNYYTSGTVTYDSTNKWLTLGANSTSGSGVLGGDNNFPTNLSDYVHTERFYFPTTYKTTSSSFEFYSRYYASIYYYVRVDYNAGTVYLYKYNAGSTILMQTAFVSVASQWYKGMLWCNGQYWKFKLWKDSDPVPTSWTVFGQDSGYTDHGIWSNRAYHKQVYNDDLYVYGSPNITVSGLPTGWTARVGGASGAVSTESGGTVTVDCSNLYFPVNTVEILDASNVVKDTFTATADVWGGDVYTYTGLFSTTLTADCFRKLRTNQTTNPDTKRIVRNSATLAGDTYRKARRAETVPGDSYRKNRRNETVPADTRRKPTQLTTLAGDTLRKLRNTATLATDTFRKARRSETVPGETYRKTRRAETVPADTLRKTQINAVLAGDSLRKLRNSFTLTGDTLRKTIRGETIGAF